MANRDVIVVGASAGGVEALSRLAKNLPADLPASVFVVLHIPAQSTSLLPMILSRAGSLPASHPEDGEGIENGRIYVAPPDRHLMIEPGRIRVVRGPTENRHRPAIDPLFRSAARAYGPGVIGVILTGTLDDGTAGLIAVKVAGGLAIVQDPSDAFCAGMPKSALRYVEADYVLPLREIGSLLARLSRGSLESVAGSVSEQMVKETKLAEFDMETMQNDDKPGTPSAFSCPDCSGVLWEIEEGNLLRFRCRVGHAYSTDSMNLAQDEAIERALWAGLRALEERAALSRRMATHARERNMDGIAIPFEEKLRQTEEQAELLREVLLADGRT